MMQRLLHSALPAARFTHISRQRLCMAQQPFAALALLLRALRYLARPPRHPSSPHAFRLCCALAWLSIC